MSQKKLSGRKLRLFFRWPSSQYNRGFVTLPEEEGSARQFVEERRHISVGN
jgi:hypothetical protein